MAIITLAELQSYQLPIDLSGYTPTQLAEKIREATAWIEGESRKGGFELRRIIDRVYGTGTNKLFTNFRPVNQLNMINLVFPPNSGNVNLPGPNLVPIDPNRIVVDHDTGELINWSPFMFQTFGYLTVFPREVPINIDMLVGYVSTATTNNISAGDRLIPVQSASGFYYGQTCRFYDAGIDEQVLMLGSTASGGVQYAIALDPLQFNHAVGTAFGDMPQPIKMAAAYVVCDFCLRELNPEDLETLELDKLKKGYAKHNRPVGGVNLDNDFIFEEERPLLKEARRMLMKYYTDRGVW